MSDFETTRTRDGDAGARIADGIRSRIVAGTYPPGTRIRQEDVAAEFGASRVPVREAIRQLEYEGLVTVVPNSGAWVSRLTLAECEEVYQMRERLEPLLLRYSAPQLGADDLGRLAELAQRISEVGEDTETFLRLDREFHLASYATAQTSQLDPLVRKLWNTTAPYRRAYVSSWDADARRIAHEEHHLMVAALKDGDLEEAERVLGGHIRRTRRHLARTPHIFDDHAH
ncbi:GntR family transcriptional regulator [Microbacterium sp. zg-Y818]|uniref:GntR family transcriptional regulator n=1 Tax=unclassified Microbacterium TaxID=2609290 RepID=UPI00214B576E|nr:MULTISPECIES: GntR family transcriptional regulator [unclassified Microbacterium]MCR2799556.1 GntR family transcriptional regulator [Microbacterium sp. zg.Y818]WIM21550.1 GntR family transcriptional regulator [Microbacterium sp. zg-Y818]